ncbi:hypothetical protein COB11_05865 [Candidatus Aerophobetes bacterium]|uniref:GrpB family protein n=1 Tax=Aerophobetes bacterium TaxID=2030807 RepID=A0A2A4YFL6_UNCAE|nr:MAG: hypothetical protein COB11_05865 [Candidatus Aerophobetes bacterium]
MAKTLEIAPYNSEWPKLFDKEKKILSKPLYNWVFDTEHIGSTAIPGLAAKPTIDILMGVADFDVVDVFCIDPMIDLGYDYIEEYEKIFPERRFFQKLDKDGNHLFHVHLVQFNGPFWHKHLFFRNYLRKHKDVAKEYETLKKDLLSKNGDIEAYLKGKTSFVRKIESLMKK